MTGISNVAVTSQQESQPKGISLNGTPADGFSVSHLLTKFDLYLSALLLCRTDQSLLWLLYSTIARAVKKIDK